MALHPRRDPRQRRPMDRVPAHRRTRIPAVLTSGRSHAVTRIDMTTREWHELITPVLPHASTGKDDPQLSAIRIEIAERAIFAVATDRYTLAAERHYIKAERAYDPPSP